MKNENNRYCSDYSCDSLHGGSDFRSSKEKVKRISITILVIVVVITLSTVQCFAAPDGSYVKTVGFANGLIDTSTVSNSMTWGSNYGKFGGAIMISANAPKSFKLWSCNTDYYLNSVQYGFLIEFDNSLSTRFNIAYEYTDTVYTPAVYYLSDNSGWRDSTDYSEQGDLNVSTALNTSSPGLYQGYAYDTYNSYDLNLYQSASTVQITVNVSNPGWYMVYIRINYRPLSSGDYSGFIQPINAALTDQGALQTLSYFREVLSVSWVTILVSLAGVAFCLGMLSNWLTSL